MNKDRDRARGQGAGALGFSLIETVIAIAVIAVTFIGLIGLLGLGVANDQASTQQTVATNIASSILADLRSTPANSSKSVRFGMTLPTANPGTAAAPFSGSGATPAYFIYFDNSANWLPLGSPALYTGAQSPVPSGAAYVANLYLAELGTVGPTVSQCNDMARVVVSWPATTIPAGSVDVISQFVLH